MANNATPPLQHGRTNHQHQDCMCLAAEVMEQQENYANECFSFLLQHGEFGIIETNVAQAKEKRRPDMLRAKALEYLQEYKAGRANP
ncbi:hypothetical protein FCV25MIE_30658 [Fagus crenata]